MIIVLYFIRQNLDFRQGGLDFRQVGLDFQQVGLDIQQVDLDSRQISEIKTSELLSAAMKAAAYRDLIPKRHA